MAKILVVQYHHMEFERNKPVTADDIALADAQKVSLKPIHTDIHAQEVIADRSHRNEAIFAFESETTDAANVQPSAHPHRRTALIVALACAVVFGGVIFLLYSLR